MIKKIALFGLAASATSVFATGSLWAFSTGKDVSYQVQTPEVVACTGGDPSAMPDYGSACFESTAGWWYVYDIGKEGTGSTVSPIGTDDEGKRKLKTTDEKTGDILAGGNLDGKNGLWADFTCYGNGTDGGPGIFGFGFDWTKSKSTIDVSGHDGFCITYSWSNDEYPMQLELGWNSNDWGDDTWYVELPAGSKSLSFKWAQFTQEAWDKEHSTTTDTYTHAAESVKIRLKHKMTTPVGGTFVLEEFGWDGECGAASGDVPTPSTAISSAKAVSAAKVMLNGRSLSVAGLASTAKVEVVNLHGQVVASETISGSAAMNLVSLDAGIYMVRVQGNAVNYTQKVVLK